MGISKPAEPAECAHLRQNLAAGLGHVLLLSFHLFIILCVTSHCTDRIGSFLDVIAYGMDRPSHNKVYEHFYFISSNRSTTEGSRRHKTRHFGQNENHAIIKYLLEVHSSQSSSV